MVGILIITIPFWFRNNKSFSLLWEGVRYFTVFIYFSAFLWKLLRGSVFHPGQGLGIFLNGGGSNLIYNPDSLFGGWYAYAVSHPSFAQWVMLAGVAMEAIFIIGFFTRRFDLALFVIPFLFHTITWIFLDVFFFELLILNLAFLPGEWFSLNGDVPGAEG